MSEDAKWAMGLVPRRVREPGDPPEGPPPTAHCCATAASFRALRCHCWHGFSRIKVRSHMSQCYTPGGWTAATRRQELEYWLSASTFF